MSRSIGRLASACAAVIVVAIAGHAVAQNAFPTPQGSAAGGAVIMCPSTANASLYVPCSTTNPGPFGAGGGGVVGNVSNATSGVAPTATNIGAVSYLYGWNGSTWDQASLYTVGVAGTPSTQVVSTQFISGGVPYVVGGGAAEGAAVSGNSVITGGWDGTNVYRFRTISSAISSNYTPPTTGIQQVQAFTMTSNGDGTYSPPTALATSTTPGSPASDIMTTQAPNFQVYSVGVAGLVPAAAATDIFCVTGSATKTVNIQQFQISGIATAAAAVDVVVVKRSTANTGGTSTTPTIVPLDSANAAVTAVVNAYTANPTTGTLVGNVAARKITIATAAAAIPIMPTIFEFVSPKLQGLTLRGTAQVACLNWNGQTNAGNSVDVSVRFTEE